MEVVFIALGSNLAEPLQQVENALFQLDNLPKTSIIKCSSYYRSRPLGPKNQPDYLNAVVAIKTALQPEELLVHTQFIEAKQGRDRQKSRFGPRTLDLDILLFGNRIISTKKLTIPHYDMHQREFMLYPLEEIAPNLQLPNGTTLVKLRRKIARNGLIFWHDNHLLSY
ncbi:2-amino-4-hydroxy-6-hydroxymethyldihydropteridine diphosphokinase [Candidatus Palibaumannia cicadellinicola]|uniref:2-amino-4-hydroxy-6-hydroxymethyldihydropteridine pyrophosphokinase n=1 Tax=Baumannia cicadellinicola subsp. Homalodisca coagulata TaxID=374463 RepID=Q1LTN2_BAUCH|nr:2-amino-4-hydroxy-6-hydroxymethyldihydropteridine diphosphokinase [Candidatus Baumannia cicadellinicola]ABF14340.1 7, 8-dihydro-6-hydroxymethylpterin-pyrophosphokina se [Baumannia cicadellinicola str. Hc (Homalodisca coagulata)]MBS0032694.1 2-amino-4-hydroxy-6-hydroxymethyldihydropteridine diphosphokinase [Candidatus Baumannia cicadellinicola]MCJ7462335.1 2-amino-4-hydroxy-6-hydroxymethyldihydropteridine diphosphokinase [Candidatus Baumannia cicadellinicola]